MARNKGLSTMLTAAFAVVAHVVLLLAPATCTCAPERPAPEAAAHACCCKPGEASTMPCHSKGKPASEHERGGCASSHASCQAEPPASLAASEVAAAAHAHDIAPVIAVLVAPPVAAPAALAGTRERDDGSSRAAPIGLVLARTTVLLI